jgi:hypothetical protein
LSQAVLTIIIAFVFTCNNKGFQIIGSINSTFLRKNHYILSPMGGVDLIAILPAYLSLFFAGTQYLLVIRAFRILRVFRILKMWNFINASHMLIKALHTSAIKIGVFLLFVVVSRQLSSVG